MSLLDKDKLFQGLFSIAGIVSAEKYKILEEFKKTKDKERDRDKSKYFHDSFHPDKEWQESLLKKEIIKPSDIIKGCKFNINELKSEIKKHNLYFKDEPKIKKVRNMKKNLYLKNNNYNKKRKNPIINRKYKYHDLHMRKIARYKKEGIYEKILNQQESVYYPKLDFVYKKIESGPKWEKLVGRGKLFETDIKRYNSINIFPYEDEKEKGEKEEKDNNSKKKEKNNSLISIMPKINKSRNSKKNFKNKLDSIKYTNLMTKSTSTFSKINLFNKHNNYNNSTSDNLNYNSSTIFTQKKGKHTPDKKITFEYPDITLYNMKKCKSVLDFGKYLDYEKLEKKIKKNHQINRIKNVLNPNYTSIESNIKMFVKYNNSINHKKGKNKTINFEGINTNELLYDANCAFEKIYGNKLKAVPLFHKMIARPNDINLPSYMKGLYSRMGLFLANEKTLQMNNYENAKMYKFDGDFTPKKKRHFLRSIYFDDVPDIDKNKIQRDLELMKKKFRNIDFTIYYD